MIHGVGFARLIIHNINQDIDSRVRILGCRAIPVPIISSTQTKRARGLQDRHAKNHSLARFPVITIQYRLFPGQFCLPIEVERIGFRIDSIGRRSAIKHIISRYVYQGKRMVFGCGQTRQDCWHTCVQYSSSLWVLDWQVQVNDVMLAGNR